MPKFYLVATRPDKLIITRYYDSIEEAYDNKEFLELDGFHVRLKIKEAIE